MSLDSVTGNLESGDGYMGRDWAQKIYFEGLTTQPNGNLLSKFLVTRNEGKVSHHLSLRGLVEEDHSIPEIITTPGV